MGSFVSAEWSLGIACVHSCSSQTSRVHSEFTRARSGSSGSFELAFGHTAAPCGHRVHSDLRKFTRARIGVVGFIRVRVERALGSLVSFGFAWVHSGVPRCLRVHSGSLGFTRVRPLVVEFILFRVASLMRS